MSTLLHKSYQVKLSTRGKGVRNDQNLVQLVIERPRESSIHIFYILRGYSITTWTRFCSFLTPSPLTWTILLDKTYEVT